MKMMNWILMLTWTLSSFAQAPTWEQRITDARARLNLTTANVEAALASFAQEVRRLKQDREEHKNMTADTSVRIGHAQDEINLLANGLGNTTLTQNHNLTP